MWDVPCFYLREGIALSIHKVPFTADSLVPIQSLTQT